MYAWNKSSNPIEDYLKSTDDSCLSSIKLDEVVKSIKNDFPLW